ncbi:MAG: ATP-binding protein [Acidobacteriota bacterium]|nr:ATP-binding protein [Acidobacteriota bacterium]
MMNQRPGTRPSPRSAVLLPAALALACGLLPYRRAAWAAAALVLWALVFLLATWSRQPRSRLLPAVLLVLGGLATTPEWRPVPGPDHFLAPAAEQVQQRWREQVEILDAAVAPPPPAGGDYAWLDQRRQSLGERGGLTVLPEGGGPPLGWSGWTTPLAAGERARLAASLAPGPALMVLRRGLSLRLVCARRYTDPARWLVAEIALPPEPAPGPLGGGLGPHVQARLRWEAVGEGIQAEIGGTDEGTAPAFWSMIPLQAPDGSLMARATLTQSPPEVIARDHARRRQGLFGLLGTLWLIATAMAGGRGGALRLAVARGVWLVAQPAPLLGLGSAATAPWLPETLLPTHPWARWLAEGLVGRPLDAALTGLALAGVSALVGLPLSPRRRRGIGIGGLALAGTGLGLVHRLTLATELSPGAVVLPEGGGVVAALLMVALAALPWAGFQLALRCLGSAVGGRTWLAAALLAGLTAGSVHALTLPAAGRQRAVRELAPELLQRGWTWENALLETLALAVPPDRRPVLARERDAIDLWWNSPLGRMGLASGVWKYDARGRVVDRFITGVPPVDPEPRLVAADLEDGPTGPFPRRFDAPEVETQRFVEGQFRLVRAEVLRPDGGSWVAAILAEPGNIPSRRADDPLGAAIRAETDKPILPRRGALEPRLAWFDPAGHLLHSELEAGPPAPLAPPTAPRWRRIHEPGSRGYDVYEVADATGTLCLAVVPPGLLEMAAIPVGWAVSLLAGALLTLALHRIEQDPRGAVLGVFPRLRAAAGRFGVQVGLVLVVAGLAPLLALAGAGRAAASAQAHQRLTSDGRRTAHFARRLVEDYLALGEGEPLAATDAEPIAAWLARTLGENLFLWRDGALAAGSRSDLVRAGLWPERLPGRTWRELTLGRRPLLIRREGLLSAAASGAAVVYSPYRGPDGNPGVLTIPLARAGRRYAESLADMDRALLVSTALLLALSFALLRPATRRLVRPLSQLEQATGRLAAGHFDSPIPVAGCEETRSLGRAFRLMARSLARQQRGLERRRAAIETIIASIPLAVMAVTRDRRVWAANPRAGQLLGVTPAEALRLGNDPLARTVERLVGQGGERRESLEIDEGDRHRHLRVSALDLPGLEEGRGLRLIVIEDLTDAVQSERLAAWAEMARRIAHEIKNPLTPISLMVSHVQRLLERRDPGLEQSLTRALATIDEQVQVLRETAREFADYSHLLHASLEPVDLAPEVRTWLAAYAMAEDDATPLEMDGPANLPPLPADTRLLRRAVVNLVDNARAAAAETGGRVRVRWGVRDQPAPAIWIRVEDDGPGIEPGTLGRLFEPDVTTRETGSGLGLPIARQAVEAHGGTIEVDSSPGRGSRFTVVLPRPAGCEEES